MFRTSLKLFKVFGIEIRLDLSWFIIFALFVYYFGFQYFPDILPGASTWILAVVTLVTIILFFSSALIHEISHSLVARSQGTPVKRIILFIFGGMAQIEREPETAKGEFIMAIAGPAASFVLAIVFGIVWFFSRSIEYIGEPARYLALINIMLGTFNLLPGYPLDGGRVLRSIVWKVTGNLKRATFIASIGGRIIGFLLIGAGIVLLFYSNYLTGVWLAFIGWFLQSSARAGYRQIIFQTAVKGVKVKDVMNEDIIEVDKDITLQRLVDDYFTKHRLGRFPVVEDMKSRRLIGVISLHEAKGVAREKWPTVKAGDIVKPISEDEKVNMSMKISDAIKEMGNNDLGHLVIMSGKRLSGIITKSDILRFIKLKSELR